MFSLELREAFLLLFEQKKEKKRVVVAHVSVKLQESFLLLLNPIEFCPKQATTLLRRFVIDVVVCQWFLFIIIIIIHRQNMLVILGKEKKSLPLSFSLPFIWHDF